MSTIKTQTDIHVFADRLITAGIELPTNMHIGIKLTEEQFDRIIHPELETVDSAEYNGARIKVMLIKNK